MIIFGQELPDTAADVMVQVFSVMVATTGLAIFALVLALVEQVVLEVLDRNVRKGSVVYEEGHLLVLAWAENRRDEETVWKILTQVGQPVFLHHACHDLLTSMALILLNPVLCGAASDSGFEDPSDGCRLRLGLALTGRRVLKEGCWQACTT